jgi:hypothetical protein
MLKMSRTIIDAKNVPLLLIRRIQIQTERKTRCALIARSGFFIRQRNVWAWRQCSSKRHAYWKSKLSTWGCMEDKCNEQWLTNKVWIIKLSKGFPYLVASGLNPPPTILPTHSLAVYPVSGPQPIQKFPNDGQATSQKTPEGTGGNWQQGHKINYAERLRCIKIICQFTKWNTTQGTID